MKNTKLPLPHGVYIDDQARPWGSTRCSTGPGLQMLRASNKKLCL